MPRGRLHGRLWRYLHKFNGVLALFYYIYRVSPHFWHNFDGVGLNLYGVCPHILYRVETGNLNELCPHIGHDFYVVSPQIANQIARRIRINGNPVTSLDG